MSRVLVLTPLDFAALPISTGLGEDSRVIQRHFREAMNHYWGLPVSRRSTDTIEKFYELLREWKEGCGLTSSVTQLAMHPAYQRIIGMGAEAVPLILQELERSPDHWFWALNAITGADPVEPKDRGRLRKMAEDWIRWGKEQGYRW